MGMRWLMGVRFVPDAIRVIVRALWGIEGLTRLSESLKYMVQYLNRHPIATFYSDCHVRSHGVHHYFSTREQPVFTAKSRFFISLVIGFVNHI